MSGSSTVVKAHGFAVAAAIKIKWRSPQFRNALCLLIAKVKCALYILRKHSDFDLAMCGTLLMAGASTF